MLDPANIVESPGTAAATSRAMRPSNGSSHESRSSSALARATSSARRQAASHDVSLAGAAESLRDEGQHLRGPVADPKARRPAGAGSR